MQTELNKVHNLLRQNGSVREGDKMFSIRGLFVDMRNPSYIIVSNKDMSVCSYIPIDDSVVKNIKNCLKDYNAIN